MADSEGSLGPMFVPRVSLPEHMPVLEGQWYIFDSNNDLLLVDGEVPVGSESPVALSDVHILGLLNGLPIRAGSAKSAPIQDPPGRQQWRGLRASYGKIPETDWVMAGRASQVLAWDKDHQFCGRCATATEPHPIDRSRRCPQCSVTVFPRISPAVIMLVERDAPKRSSDGGPQARPEPEILLAWGRGFRSRFFSSLAGFVEPGESLEECVAREVREEVGIEISDIRYFGSQPWPFPNSMMIGFTARYQSGEIEIQEDEIIEAGWFGGDALPPCPIGGMSIAGSMIESWLEATS